MGEENPTPLSTTAVDLVTAIDATLARCFGALDEAEEARRLGLPVGAVRALREKLEALRALAAKAAEDPDKKMPAKAGGPGAGDQDKKRPDTAGPRPNS